MPEPVAIIFYITAAFLVGYALGSDAGRRARITESK